MFYFFFLFFFNKLIYYIHALFEFDLCVSSGEEWVLKFKKLKKCKVQYNFQLSQILMEPQSIFAVHYMALYSIGIL